MRTRSRRGWPGAGRHRPAPGPAPPGPAPTGTRGPGSTAPSGSSEAGLETSLIGQDEALAALRGLAARPGRPLRLLISGPDGTGKHDLALELARLMRGRGLKESPLWISEAMFARQSDAVSTFHKNAR